MQHIKWENSQDPDAGEISNQIRKMGYAVTAHPVPAGQGELPHTVREFEEEVVWLARGQLQIRVDDSVFILNPGDHLEGLSHLKYFYTSLSPTGCYYFIGKKNL